MEMQTGEGKTLTASLASATAVLAGIPTHVHTVNDYLAARDAVQLRPIYEALGISVGVVEHGQSPVSDAQPMSVTSPTERTRKLPSTISATGLLSVGVDVAILVGRLYRDEGPPLLLRGLQFAIVDEADSILIDEARTPLTISGMSGAEDVHDMYATALRLADGLVAGRDWLVRRTASQSH